MTKLKTLFVSALAICLSHCCSLQGFFESFNEFELEFDSGARWDRIDEMTEVIDKALIVPYSSTGKQFKTLTSWIIGGKGFIDYCDFVLKGSGHYGWIVAGDYDQDHIQDSSIRGHTVDGTIGFGYAMPVYNFFWFLPLVGYGYDELDLHINPTRSFDPALFPATIESARFDASFYGPWIGFDILFDACYWRCYNVSFAVGYEFHYGWSRTKWDQLLVAGGNFGYHTFLSNMMGNVFRFDAQYRLPCDWLAGLELQFTHWANAHTNHSRFDPGSSAGPSPSQFQDVFKLNWQSLAIMGTITKAF